MFYFKNQLAGHVIPQPTTTVVVIHSIERPFLVLLPQQFVPVSRCPGSSTHPSVSVDVRPLCRLLPRHVSPSPTPPALRRCVATDRAVFFMALHRPLLLFAAPGAGSALRAPCRAIGVPFARSSRGVPSRPSCAGRRAMRPAAAVVVVVIDQGGRAAGPSRAHPSGGATPKALCPVVPSPSLGGLALAPPPRSRCHRVRRSTSTPFAPSARHGTVCRRLAGPSRPRSWRLSTTSRSAADAARTPSRHRHLALRRRRPRRRRRRHRILPRHVVGVGRM